MSPMTNLPLVSTVLIPNIALRSIINSTPRSPKVDAAYSSVIDVSLHKSKFGSVLKISSSLLDPIPVHIVAAVDVSGSMDSAANAGVENNGVTLLDLVKKCLEMLVKMLSPGDRMSLVVYSTDVRVLARSELMSDDGKARMLKRVADLRAGGMTNYFASLTSSFDLCSDVNNSVIFNFTDGRPNVKEPPRGYTHSLASIKCDRALPVLYAFGFGNNLCSDILVESSEICDGRFVHVPTVNFVGTSFAHAIANVRETLHRNIKVLADHASPREDCVEAGTVCIKNGGTVGFVMETLLGDGKTAIKLTTQDGKNIYSGCEGENSPPVEIVDKGFGLVHLARHALVKLLRRVLRTKRDEACDKSLVAAWLTRVQCMLACSEEPHSKALRGFLKYFKGETEDDAQILKALDLTGKPYWATWGKNYVSSLYFALKYQECHNFKDEGVQGFGSVIFESERDKASELYMKLPPIKPSRAARSAAPVHVGRYHCSGGCFAGETVVSKCKNGRRCQVPLHDIKAGDFVVTADGSLAEIECLLHTNCSSSTLYKVQGSSGYVYATAYHPVSLDNGNTWTHPKDITLGETINTPYGIYSFLLKKKKDGTRPHSVLLADCVAGISLAHGVQLCKSMRSIFWDTELVVEEMKLQAGYKSGIVEVAALQRCSETNLVVAFK